ncbi:MAG: hypothetical protein LBU85_10445 [Treponema sp.]|jgi:electron transport complex protein RnfA|nr:hypothetical protein [Treponema sp.]
MHNNLAWFLTLAIFSGMSMNLILRFGIGLQRVSPDEDSRGLGKNAKWVFLARMGVCFASIILLWLFFSLLQSVLFLGFFEYILVFPLSSLFFTAAEYLAGRLVLKTNWKGELVSRNRFISDYFLTGSPVKGSDQSSLDRAAVGAPVGGGVPVNGVAVGGAPVGAALFIILGLAGGLAQAAMFSFGFSAGAALAVLIVGEIRRRSAMEAVPRCLRNGPLVLVAAGLLSLVFTCAAAVFYAVLGAS